MTQQQKKGFTIIEVVLVLAIAGLIFLMVFIALPALQRSQRDQARKNDVSVVASAVNTYKSNNRGSLSGITEGSALEGYIDRLDQYETGDVIVRSGSTSTSTPVAGLSVDKIVVVAQAKCPSMPSPSDSLESVTVDKGTSRSAVIITLLENNGSKKAAYCQDV